MFHIYFIACIILRGSREGAILDFYKNTCKEKYVFTKLKENLNLLLLHQLNKIQHIHIYIYVSKYLSLI